MVSPTALVTGGAGGLGLVIAEALDKAGYRVAVFDCNRDRLTALGTSRFIALEVDVTDENSVLNGVAQVVAITGRIDVLVNNAGTIMSEPVVNLLNRERPRHDFGNFKRTVDVNLNSVFLVGSVVATEMVIRRTSGVIVNISSVCAAGNPGQSAYSAAKAGIEALTRTWGRELGVFGIRTVAVAPGFIDTESTRQALSAQRLHDLKGRIPLRRLGRAEEVAQTVLFSVQNEYINGVVVDIDGGVTL